MDVILDETAARIRLPANSGLTRDRVTPVEARTPDYDQKYDLHTFCYDVFDIEGAAALVCPPLLNLERAVQLDGRKLGDRLFQIDRRRKVDVIRAEGWSAGRPFTADLDGLPFERSVSPNGRAAFAGRRAVLTMFKFEPLLWLHDWIEFNIRYHGADAALIYCNDLPHLTPQQVVDGLRDIPGLATLGVVDFPFPYGPDRGLWNANFCQYGMLEHARLKYLSEAQGVLAGDIDELILTSNQTPAFDILDTSESGYLLVGGEFVSNEAGSDPDTPVLQRRYWRYDHISPRVESGFDAGTKWLVAPKRTPTVQWQTHNIRGLGPIAPRDDLDLRHFIHMTVGWKNARPSGATETRYDSKLTAAYRRVGWID